MLSSIDASESAPAAALLAQLDTWAGASFESAAPLPGWMYTSPVIAQVELDRLFHRGWVCVGRSDELPNVGDYISAVIGEQPVVIARNGAGEVHAMSNVCAHRGMLLVEGTGNATTFRCGYHSWVYGEMGALRSAPHMNESPQFDKAAICLPRYSVEVWHGYIFVNLAADAADAAPLGPELAGLDGVYESLGVRDFRVAMRSEIAYECNWKVLAENFCESYHVGTVHTKTLEPTTRTRTTKVHPGGDGYNLHTMTSRSAEGKPTSDVEDFSWLSCIYPSFTISVGRSSAISLLLQPDGAERVRCTALVALPHEDGDDDWPSQERLDLVEEFMAEDKLRIEAVQKGLHGYEPLAGTYCHMERTNWEFGQYLHRQLCRKA